MTAIAMTHYGALPAVRISAPDGAVAIVTLYGAHLVSWTDAGGTERLFCSAKSALDGSRAIRGGVPVIFPQFAERGTGMRHGFARVSTWHLTDSGPGFAVFGLSNAELKAPWEHAFALALKVQVGGGSLALDLEVRNTGTHAFAFASALHTYFAVPALSEVRIGGLQDGPLTLDDKLDRIFPGVAGPITLGDLRLTQQGFTDAVVWNPGALDAAALADLGDEEYQRFVCIEPALIDPLTLAPGAIWTGHHSIHS